MPLDLTGQARLADIDMAKHGAAADDAQLEVGYKLRMTTDAGVLAYFAPDLRASLFNPQTGEPRFANMGPVKWKGSQRGVAVRMERIDFAEATLRGFVFEPLPGGKVLLNFTAVTWPTPKQVSDTAQLLETDIDIMIGQGDVLDLDGDSKREPHKTTAPDLKPLKTALNNAELALTEWPKPDTNGEYSQPSEILNFKDETLHVNCWARIKLLQIGPAQWIGVTDMAVPGDEPQADFTLNITNAIHPSRATIIANEVEYIDAFTTDWLKKNKRSLPAHKGAVVALQKWAKGLLVGGAPASVKEAELVATPKVKKTRGKA